MGMVYIGNRSRIPPYKNLENIGGAEFLPTDIAGLRLWYDLSDATTMFTDAGITPVSLDNDAIYQINEKSGVGSNLIQTNIARRPLYKTNVRNGLSAGLGNTAATKELTSMTAINYSQPLTIFAVAAVPNNGTLQNISAEGVRSGYQSSNRLSMYAGIFVDSANNAFVDNTWYILRYEFNGASSKIYRNGTLVVSGNAGANALSRMSLFSAYGQRYLNGYIGEHLAYNSILDAAVASQLENNYFNAKWSVF